MLLRMPACQAIRAAQRAVNLEVYHGLKMRRHAHDFFNRAGELRHIKKLKFWPLEEVLVEKYELAVEEVRGFDIESVSEESNRSKP